MRVDAQGRPASISGAFGFGAAALVVFAFPIAMFAFLGLIAYSGCMIHCEADAQTDWVTTVSYLGIAGLLVIDVGLWAWAGYRLTRPVPLIIAAVPVVVTGVVVAAGMIGGAF
ncbi:hypothetical protein [Brevibacterium casei]